MEAKVFEYTILNQYLAMNGKKENENLDVKFRIRSRRIIAQEVDVEQAIGSFLPLKMRSSKVIEFLIPFGADAFRQCLASFSTEAVISRAGDSWLGRTRPFVIANTALLLLVHIIVPIREGAVRVIP